MTKLRLAVQENSLSLLFILTLLFISCLVLFLIYTKIVMYQFLYIALIMYYILKVIYYRMFGVFND